MEVLRMDEAEKVLIDRANMILQGMPVEPGRVIEELFRQYPGIGLVDLEGIRGDLIILKVAKSIISNPSKSPRQVWEDRFLYPKGGSGVDLKNFYLNTKE